MKRIFCDICNKEILDSNDMFEVVVRSYSKGHYCDIDNFSSDNVCYECAKLVDECVCNLLERGNESNG